MVVSRHLRRLGLMGWFCNLRRDVVVAAALVVVVVVAAI